MAHRTKYDRQMMEYFNQLEETDACNSDSDCPSSYCMNYIPHQPPYKCHTYLPKPPPLKPCKCLSCPANIGKCNFRKNPGQNCPRQGYNCKQHLTEEDCSLMDYHTDCCEWNPIIKDKCIPSCPAGKVCYNGACTKNYTQGFCESPESCSTNPDGCYGVIGEKRQ